MAGCPLIDQRQQQSHPRFAEQIMSAVRSLLVGVSPAAAAAAISLMGTLASTCPPALLKCLIEADLVEYLFECLRGAVPGLVGWGVRGNIMPDRESKAAATLNALNSLSRFEREFAIIYS